MRKILVVDPDYKFLSDLEGLSLINRNPGVEIMTAKNAGDAQRLLRDYRPDEVYLSNDMADTLSGWENMVPSLWKYPKGTKADEVLRKVSQGGLPPRMAKPAGRDPRLELRMQQNPRDRCARQEPSPAAFGRQTSQYPGTSPADLAAREEPRQGINQPPGVRATQDTKPIHVLKTSDMIQGQKTSPNGNLPGDAAKGPGQGYVSFGLPKEEEDVMRTISQDVRSFTGPSRSLVGHSPSIGADNYPSPQWKRNIPTDPRTAARNRQMTGYIPSREINQYMAAQEVNRYPGATDPRQAYSNGDASDPPAGHGPYGQSPDLKQDPRALLANRHADGPDDIILAGEEAGPPPGDQKKKKRSGRKRKNAARSNGKKDAPQGNNPPVPSDGADGIHVVDKKDTGIGIGIIVAAFAIILVLALAGSKFWFANAHISSASMEPTVMTDSRVFGSRIAYKENEVERGDIILFDSQVDYGNTYLKRVIGLPGETVEIRDGKIYIDGSETPLEEDYLDGEWTVNNDGYSYTVPEGSYFVLGDNRDDSFDSRLWADYALNNGWVSTEEEAQAYTYVSEDDIIAKALFVYFPPSQMKSLS